MVPAPVDTASARPLDEGIAAGLSGGGKLTFSQRITEGKPQCEASFDLEHLR